MDGVGRKAHHFHCDLVRARLQLHEQSIAPRVCLTASGAVRQLVYNDLVLHMRPPETDVCLGFARVFEEVFGSPIAYGGESLASFCARVFAEMCASPQIGPCVIAMLSLSFWRSSAAGARPAVRT